MGDSWQRFEFMAAIVMGLCGTLFTGTCGVFLIFLSKIEKRSESAIQDFSRRLEEAAQHFGDQVDKISDSLSNVTTQLTVVIERTSSHEKRLDRIDLGKRGGVH